MFNIFKVRGPKIVLIEKSELLHWVTKLPGFVSYPQENLLPLSTPHGRAKEKRQSTVKLKKSHTSSHGSNSASSGVSSIEPSADLVQQDHQISQDPISSQPPVS